jgi:hypothetical protein
MAPGTGPIDLTRAVWRTSTRSSSEGQNCVEVAANLPCIVAVRDSRHPAGPALVVTPRSWMTFIRAVQAGAFVRSTLAAGWRRAGQATRTFNTQPRSAGGAAWPGWRWPACWPRGAVTGVGLSR